MSRQIIHTDKAPAAIGTYSQAVRCGNTVYLSGQTPIVPATGQLVEGDFRAQVHQAFSNLREVCTAAGGDFSKVARLGLYLTDLANFSVVNEVMAEYFAEPYPARSTIGVKQLPRNCDFEVDGILILD